MQATQRLEDTAARSEPSPRSHLSLVARREPFPDDETHQEPPEVEAEGLKESPSRHQGRFGSVEVIPFEKHHARLIVPQPAQREEVDRQLQAPDGPAWTAVVDGLPVACAGFVPVWEGRAYAWALLGADSGQFLRQITRAIRWHLDSSGFRRVEMAVDRDFENGRQWARLLGFECEGLARSYLPNGRDAWIYARVI